METLETLQAEARERLRKYAEENLNDGKRIYSSDAPVSLDLSVAVLGDCVEDLLTSSYQAGVEAERSNWRSVLDADSCECDNCHRTRRYLKDPEKELRKAHQRLQALSNPSDV